MSLIHSLIEDPSLLAPDTDEDFDPNEALVLPLTPLDFSVEALADEGDEAAWFDFMAEREFEAMRERVWADE